MIRSPGERSAIRNGPSFVHLPRITLRSIRATLADGLRCTGPGVRRDDADCVALSLLQTSLHAAHEASRPRAVAVP